MKKNLNIIILGLAALSLSSCKKVRRSESSSKMICLPLPRSITWYKPNSEYCLGGLGIDGSSRDDAALEASSKLRSL